MVWRSFRVGAAPTAPREPEEGTHQTQIYKRRELAIADVADYIDSFYNRPRRNHLGGLGPERFEAMHKPRRQPVH